MSVRGMLGWLGLSLGLGACAPDEGSGDGEDGDSEAGDEALNEVVGRCTNAAFWDDDGLWALSLERLTGCPWKCPPNYAYQQATPIAGYEGWAAELASEPSIELLILGDEGQLDPNAAAVVAQAALGACEEAGCDLGLLLGDNFYSHAVTDVESGDWARWREAFEGFCTPSCDAANTFHFWVSLGNHDYFPPSEDANRRRLGGNAIQAQIDYTAAPGNAGHLWMMPDRSYEIPGLPSWLGLWVIDTVVEVETLKWENERQGEGVVHEQIAGVLEQLEADEPDRWRIVAGHHPALTVGKRGRESRKVNVDDFRCQSYLEVDTMRRVADDLAEAGMQVFITAHEHSDQLHAGNRYLEVLTGSATKPSSGELTSPEPAIFAREGAQGFAIASFTPEKVVVQFYEVSSADGASARALPVLPAHSYTRAEIGALRQVLGPLLDP